MPGGFTRDDFRVDLAAGTVTCPAAHTVTITPAGKAVFDWRCRACPLAARCTRAKDGRTLQLHPHQRELQAARRRASTPEFQASDRRWRPMAERSIAWLVANGHRRVRYRGVTRNQHGLELRVAAINLRRLLALGLTRNQHGLELRVAAINLRRLLALGLTRDHDGHDGWALA